MLRLSQLFSLKEDVQQHYIRLSPNGSVGHTESSEGSISPRIRKGAREDGEIERENQQLQLLVMKEEESF